MNSVAGCSWAEIWQAPFGQPTSFWLAFFLCIFTFWLAFCVYFHFLAREAFEKTFLLQIVKIHTKSQPKSENTQKERYKVSQKLVNTFSLPKIISAQLQPAVTHWDASPPQKKRTGDAQIWYAYNINGILGDVFQKIFRQVEFFCQKFKNLHLIFQSICIGRTDSMYE